MRFKYSKPINSWDVGMRKPVMQICAQFMKPEYRPKKTTSMQDMKWYGDIFKFNLKAHRNAIGLIRAMGSKHFFKGCYIGAEND